MWSPSTKSTVSPNSLQGFPMSFPIHIIIAYVGGDLSTPFAREHVEKMKKTLLSNPDGPMCLLLDDKELHMDFVSMCNLLENGYFSMELLEKMKPFLSWPGVFRSDRIPLEFILKNGGKYSMNFWSCPRLPLTILREEAKTTSLFSSCEFILRNPALFSEGVEEAEKIVEIILQRKKATVAEAAYELSCNSGASLIFFLRNPRYISWLNICKNEGKVLRGEIKAVLTFLNSGKGSWTEDCWMKISSNRTVPLQFYEENWSKLDVTALASNTSVPLSFWQEYMLHVEEREHFLILVKNPTVPFSLVCSNLKYHEESERSFLLQMSYNVPVDAMIEMCRDNPQVIDWDTIAANRGFWLHLAEKALRPVLESFFGEMEIEREIWEVE